MFSKKSTMFFRIFRHSFERRTSGSGLTAGSSFIRVKADIRKASRHGEIYGQWPETNRTGSHAVSHRIHGAGIYANIWGIFMVNVTIYSIHGSYGIWILCWVWVMGIPCWPAQASLVEVVEAQQRACCRSRLPPLLRALRPRTAQTKTPYFLLTVAFVPSLSGMSMYAQNSSIHFAFHAQNKLA